jgi:toxin ParE1/3/4
MKVRIGRAAMADLLAIGRYIKQDNPFRSQTFIQELEDKCLELADLPLAFPIIPHSKNKTIRRRVHGNYLILYRVVGEQVQVLRILHGARDHQSWLFEDE